MKKKIIFLFIVTLSLIVSGCGEDEGSESEGSSTTAQGWHFQGRDCLACHNVDLQDSEHLLVGGTLYKDKNVTNQDDINNVCGGEIVVNFYDPNNLLTPIYSSADFKDVNSKGYKGKGNLFILQRELGLISSGDYFIELTTTSGAVLANKFRHTFSAQPYDINNPSDWGNRVSCNACHSSQQNAKAYPLYVTSSVSLCK